VTIELGRIEHINAREVWPHEAHDLTPWLLDNAEILGKVLNLDIELNEAEHPVGSFSLDLIGRDLTNDCVLIVENQLEQTDHTHLGQLLTYAAGTDAGTVVWISPSFRDEHREALTLLNDLGADRVRFFGVELGVIKIGDSAPAPHLQLRAEPNDWHAQASAAARGSSQASGVGVLYKSFWERYLERVSVEHPDWTNAKTPQPRHVFNLPAPFKSLSAYGNTFPNGGRIANELYIDSSDGTAAAALFAALFARRSEIEAVYGSPLEFQELPGTRACRIVEYGAGTVQDTDRHEEFIDWFFDRGERLRKAIDSVADEVQAEINA
jgi:hypothetical protein